MRNFLHLHHYPSFLFQSPITSDLAFVHCPIDPSHHTTLVSAKTFTVCAPSPSAKEPLSTAVIQSYRDDREATLQWTQRRVGEFVVVRYYWFSFALNIKRLITSWLSAYGWATAIVHFIAPLHTRRQRTSRSVRQAIINYVSFGAWTTSQQRPNENRQYLLFRLMKAFARSQRLGGENKIKVEDTLRYWPRSLFRIENFSARHSNNENVKKLRDHFFPT